MGVRVGRDKGELRAPVTILGDGVLSLLARKQGLSEPADAHDTALGVKALFRLGEQEINDRFGLVRRQGASQEFLGCTEGIRGGGFIYTQTETLSVGVVTHLDSLKARGIAPYDLLQGFLARECGVQAAQRGSAHRVLGARASRGRLQACAAALRQGGASRGRRRGPLLHEWTQPGRDEPRYYLRFFRGPDNSRSLREGGFLGAGAFQV